MKKLDVFVRRMATAASVATLGLTLGASAAWAQPADGSDLTPSTLDQAAGAPGGPPPMGGRPGMGPMGGPMGHGGPMGRGGPEGRHGPGMGQYFPERALNMVKATPEQKQQIRQIMQAARTDIQALREGGRGDRQQMRQLFVQPKVDAGAIEALRQKMLGQHDKVSLRMTKALVDAANVLSPEQRQQLGELAKKRRDMMERHRKEHDALVRPAKP